MTVVADHAGFVGRVFLEGRNSLFGAALLGNTDDGIENEDRENLHKRAKTLSAGHISRCGRVDGEAYDDGIHKDSPALLVFEEGENKRDNSGTKQNDDKLVLELL
jgi:hypothetical protein